MLAAFNHEKTSDRLVKLDLSAQRVFGALCCERMLPNYRAFQLQEGWGNAQILKEALDLVWSDLLLSTTSIDEVNKINRECEFVAPSSDEFRSLFVTAAQDACFAVCSLLDHMVQPDLDRIVKIAEYATDSIDLYVQEIQGMDPHDPNLEGAILKHPLMQRELANQDSDLAALRSIGSGNTREVSLVGLRLPNQMGSLDQ